MLLLVPGTILLLGILVVGVMPWLLDRLAARRDQRERRQRGTGGTRGGQEPLAGDDDATGWPPARS